MKIKNYIFSVKILLFILSCVLAHSLQAQVTVATTKTDVTCGANGSIVVTAIGITGTPLYAIKKSTDADFGTQQAEEYFYNLTPGTYTIAVHDDLSTYYSNPVTLNSVAYVPMVVLGTPVVGNAVVTGCDPDGSVTINMTTGKGSAPFTYHLSGGPTAKPDVIGTGRTAWTASFTQLETGTYTISITDACNNTISVNNIAVTSRYNLSGVTFGSLDGMGGNGFTGNGCDMSITFSTNNILLKDNGGNVLFQRDVKHMPSSLPIDVRVEYPAGSSIYTPWQSVFGSFALPNYLPGANTYRVEMRNPCNTSNVVSSPVYSMTYPYVSQGGFCLPNIIRTVAGYTCSPIGILLTRTSGTGATSKSYTWDGSGLSYQPDLTGLSGTYRVDITVNGSTYQSVDIKTGTATSVSVAADVYNRVCTRGCDFFTGGIRSYLSSWPADNTIPITYSIVSGPVTRDPVTSTQAVSPIWGDLPGGTYTIRVDYGDCRTETVVRPLTLAYSGFMADPLSYVPSVQCGKYRITGKGWFLAPDSTVSTSTTEKYYAALFNSVGAQISSIGSVVNNTEFTIPYDVAPGTYTVKMVNAGNSALVCYWLERTIVIPPYQPLSIDVVNSGGLVCGNNGTLHVAVTGGSGQAVTYRLKVKDAADATYTAFQSSADFPGLPAGEYTVQAQDACGFTTTQNLTLVAGATIARFNVSGTSVNSGEVTQLCPSSRVTIALIITGVASNIEWKLPNGTTVNTPTLTISNFSAADTGKYIASYNSSGCSWKDSLSLRFKANKPEFAYADTTFCGTSFNLHNLRLVSGDVTGLTLTYFVNTNYNPVANPTAVGTGAYHVVGTNAGGCTDTSNVAVVVHPIATPATIAANPVDICTGTAATLTAAVASGSTVTNPVFRWYTSQTATVPVFTGASLNTGILTTTTTHDSTFYVSVAGDNYCENLPGNRKSVKLTVYQQPTIRIETAQDTNNVCYTTTLRLEAITTGVNNWMGWYDSKGRSETSTQFAPDWHGNPVVYTPTADEAGKVNKIYVRMNGGVCGYVSDTVYVRMLPLATSVFMDIVEQPQELQEVCADTIYMLKIKSDGLGDLKNMVVTLHDINNTELTIERYATLTDSQGASVAVDTVPFPTGVIGMGNSWNIGGLVSGDSAFFQVTVSARCGFFGGTPMKFYVDAQNVCDQSLSRIERTTDPFNIVGDSTFKNTYDVTSIFYDSQRNPITAVTNVTGDTITWWMKASISDFRQPTDGSKEAVHVLMPYGLNIVPNSYNPIQNMPPRDSLRFDPLADGIDVVIPLVSGLTQNDTIEAEFQFTATNAPCKKYEFYAEIDYTYELVCGADTCNFNSTQGEAFPNPQLDVQRYRFTLADTIYGRTVDSLWYGDIHIKALSDFYAGDTILIDFYVDRDNNAVLTPADTFPRSFTYITTAVPENGVFIMQFDSVHMEPQKQLLAVVRGQSLCAPATLPIATLIGTDEACQFDTTYYYTVPGMNTYRWKVINPPDAISGATPVRIPLEGSTSANYVNESTARILWKKQGDYIVWAQYNLPNGYEMNRTYFPVLINERPVVKLTAAADTTVCEGTQVELTHFFRDTTGVGTLSYYKKETDGSYTFLSDQSPVYVKPADSTVYRATATANSSGCEALDSVDFRVNVNKMPVVGTINVVAQPFCGSSVGSIRVAVSGGSGSYQYSLNKGGTYFDLAANGIISNLPIGDYQVYVKDKIVLGCAPSISEYISLSPASTGFYATAEAFPASSCGTVDGTIRIVSNGGVPPYGYRMNLTGDEYTPIPADGIIGTNFPAGTYTIWIADSLSCPITTGAVIVGTANGMKLTLNLLTLADCQTAGTARIAITGGTAPYSYKLNGKGWITMNGAEDTLSLPAGSYKLAVKDATGCEKQGVIEIGNTADAALSLVRTVDALCDGTYGGKIVLNVTGSAQPLTYSIDGGKTYQPINAGIDSITNLPVGTYKIVLKDNVGCTFALDGIAVGRDIDFIDAIDNHVYTYVNQTVNEFLVYGDYEHKRSPLRVTFYSDGENGFGTVAMDGIFTYTPNSGFTGKDSLLYTIQNECGFHSSAWLWIDVLDTLISANRPPAAMDDYYIVKQGQTVTNIDVRINDTDPDGDVLSEPAIVSGVFMGTLTPNGNGTFNYTPNSDFMGVDGFIYEVCDPYNACATATVAIVVLPAATFDNYVTTLPDQYSVNAYDTLKVLNTANGILANDVWPQGSTAVIAIIDSVQHGDLTLNTNGTFVYHPDNGYFGPDLFSYSLCTTPPSSCDTAWAYIFVNRRDCPLPVTLNVTDTLKICETDSVNLNIAILPTSTNIDTVLFYADREHLLPLTDTFVKIQKQYYIEARNIYGCSFYDSTYVQVTRKPVLDVISGHAIATCAGDTLFLQVDTTYSTSVLWSNFANAAGTATGETTEQLKYVSHIRTVDTTFYIYITALGSSPCAAALDSIRMTIHGKPEFRFADTTACASADLTALRLIAGDTTGLTFTYWNSDYSKNVTDTAAAVTQSGIYHIVGQSLSSCKDTATVTITVNEALHRVYTIKPDGSGDFISLKQAADIYNTCGISANSTLQVSSDITETATAEFLGTAPGSTNHTLLITSDGTRRTVNGSLNTSLVKFTAANNIIIDGMQAATEANPTAPLLVFNNTYSTVGGNVRALSVDKDASNNSGRGVRVRNTEFQLASQQIAPGGGTTMRFSTDSVFINSCYVHSSYTGIADTLSRYVEIQNNIVTNNHANGIYSVLVTSANTNTNITGNVIKNLLPTTGSRQVLNGIYIEQVAGTGKWNISNNKIDSLNNQAGFECVTNGIFINSATVNLALKVNGNKLSNLTNNSISTGFALRALIIQANSSDSLQCLNDTVINVNSESYATGITVVYKSAAASPALINHCYVSTITGKGVRPVGFFNSLGISVIGAPANIIANAVYNIKNTANNAAASAIGIMHSNGGSTPAGNIYNNMVGDVAGQIGMGIYTFGAVNLYHNSVRLISKFNDTDEATAICLGDREGTTTITTARLQNNLLSNEVTNGQAQNFLIKRQPNTSQQNVIQSNNRYNIVNGNIAMVVTNQSAQTGTIYTTLNQWAAFTGDNSRLNIPAFVAGSDLHLAAPSTIDGRLHVPLLTPTVLIDYDNDPRVACINAAGADNFDPSVLFTIQNIAVTAPSCMGDSVLVSFEAVGGVTPYQYSVNGGTTYTVIPAVDSITQSGTVAIHFKAPLLGGTYTLSLKDVNNCTFVDTSFKVGSISQTAIPQTDVLFVKTTPSGKADGSSWDNAFDGKFLAWYLHNKAANGTKIYVAEGLYVPYVEGCDTNSNPRTSYFELTKNITLHGGYDSTAVGTDLSSYDPKNNITRLSSDIGIQGAATDNTYHVVYIGVNASPILDGFYISDGYADNVGTGASQNGGGIYDAGGGTRVYFSNLIIENNAADFGAGVYFNGNDTTLMDNVIIQNNRGFINYGGAGIFAWGNFLLRNSTVNDNINGSGIVSWDGDMLIVNSTIANNQVHGVNADNSQGRPITVKFINTTVANNNGIGVLLKNDYANTIIKTSFDNTLVVNNNEGNTDFGTGIAPIDTMFIMYSIFGNTYYMDNANRTKTLSVPVAIASLADNGGWGKTVALLNPCENPAVQSGNPAYTGQISQNLAVRSNPPCIGAYDGLETILINLATTPNDTICEGSAVTLETTATPPSGVSILGYQWYKDGMAITDSIRSTLHLNNITVNDAGKYTVQITTDSAGCSRMSDTITLVVNELSVTYIAGDSTVCAQDTLIYTTQDAMASYAWEIIAGTTTGKIITDTTLHTVSVVWDSAGTAQLKVTYSNAYGCKNYATYDVVVNAHPAAKISNNGTICEGEQVDLTIALTAGKKLPQWKIEYMEGTVLRSEIINNTGTEIMIIAVSPITNTTYYIKKVTDGNGCTTNY